MPRMLSLSLLLLACASILGHIELRQQEIWWPENLWNAIWCSVTVTDGVANFVRGLTVEDFSLLERAYGENNELLEERPVKFDNPYYQFGGDGFWEKSINSDKLDIAFFIDGSGSMAKHIDSIKAELRKFLDRLLETGTDFRIFISMYETEEEPDWTEPSYIVRFFGPTMAEEIRTAIEEIDTAGEWWNLNWGYDAYLWSLNLDWREDSRKIVVIITDVYTDSVYGPNWYFASGCVTSMRAVDIAIRETGIALYYCQPDEEHMAKTELSECYSPQVNIKVKENNFDKLAERNSSVKRLPWPFNQEEIELHESPIVDSKYYFAWVSDWKKYNFVSKVKVQINLLRTGESVQFVYYPLERPDGSKTSVWARNVQLTVKDESSLPLKGSRNVWVYFYKSMGELDRIAVVRSMRQISDANGALQVGDVLAGKYYYLLYSSRGPYLLHCYHDLDYTSRGWVDIGAGGTVPSEIVAYTYGKAMELYRARGLLEELDNLEITTSAIRILTEQARNWLETLSKDGITLIEMEAIKRFYVGLGALTNMAGYACTTEERSTKDVEQVVQRATEMVRKAREVIQRLESTKHRILEAVSTIIDIVTANWSGIAAKVTIEELIDRLVEYVRDELVDDIMNAVYAKLMETIENPEKLLDFFKERVRTWVEQQLSPAHISEVARGFVRNELIYSQFTSHLEKELQKLLSVSQAFVIENNGKYWNCRERSSLMKKSFEEMRKNMMGDLYAISHKALTDQRPIDDWESVLLVFRETIPLVIELLRILQYRYPEFGDIIEALETLYDVLDAIGVMTKTYELALKVDYLNEQFQHRIQTMTEAVYQFK